MSSRPLRFVQAGDFRLHQPLHGLMEAPDHLAQRLIEAPYQAAERVFDAALHAEVDFLLLTGNLCDPHRAGPRGFAFLAQQLARLAVRGIAAYWAAGPSDGRRDWPAQLKWPGVHVFASNRVEHLTHHRDGKPICQIAGRSFDEPSAALPSAAASFAPSPDGLFSIAIVPGPLPCAADDLPAIGNNYWAYGGSAQAATTLAEFDRAAFTKAGALTLGDAAPTFVPFTQLDQPPCVAHCAGTPQGRTPQDVGPYGCTMIHVDDEPTADDQDQIRLTPIATDTVRWHEERILLPAPFEQAELEHLLHERMRNSIAAAAGRTLLIRWSIEGAQADVGGFNQSAMTGELLAMLRNEYGFRESPAWSVSLTIMPAELPKSWSEQQTLLGEFLRRARELETPTAEGPEVECLLECFLSQQQLAGELAERASLLDPTLRTKVLRQAAILGAELLSSGSALRNAPARGDSLRAKEATLR